jgi:hypothetical protein
MLIPCKSDKTLLSTLQLSCKLVVRRRSYTNCRRWFRARSSGTAVRATMNSPLLQFLDTQQVEDAAQASGRPKEL